jgi:hypothetical protein
MNKKWLVVLILIAVAATAFAAPRHGRHRLMPGLGPAESAFLEAEFAGIVEKYADKSLGELTVAQSYDLLGEVSIAYQKAEFIQRSRVMSLIVPGLGQFFNEAPRAGALFLSADVLLSAGTLVGAYFLLPEELQFAHLNYLTASYDEIRTRWEAQSFVDLLPTMGVLAGGWVLQGILRVYASRNAAELARRNIAAGKVTFEPKVYLLPLLPAGAMGLGMGMRY